MARSNVLLAAMVSLAGAALAAKPGSGGSTGVGSVFVSNPMQSLGDGSFDFPGTTMTELADRTVAAAQQLYGKAAAGAATKAFGGRGIL